MKTTLRMWGTIMKNNENNHQPSFAYEQYHTNMAAPLYYTQPVSYPYHYGYAHDGRGGLFPLLFLTPFLILPFLNNRPKYVPYPYPSPYPSPYPYPTPYPFPVGAPEAPGPYYGTAREG
ncbi:hypothetical protein HMPREF0083_05838 [Aneurinibacillus aneurinilyticus ATCC 12856]|jgi:hypothetical protein|uniref:Uncharacterized protein n=2 Tax=Aneurinibacillus aneurinilyticus TaxID=1391 RepID=U1W943_ANEAE|nr:hypothetical protein HMPREF0083_05838 [Aneurinibacillus aneurinilyticus ATCC 12856]